MSISSTVSETNNTVTIKICGDFDFSLHSEFRNSYRYTKSENATYYVDLSESEYLDSSALGMLILLKEHADELNSKVILLRPSPKVEKLLNTVNFGKMFCIQKN